MALSKAERDVVVELVTATIEEVTATYERQLEGLRARVVLLEGQLTGRKSAAPVGVDLADRLAAATRTYVARTVAPLAERLAAIEGRGELVYRGVWTAGVLYQRGNFATHGGSCWACIQDTTTTPPGAAWVLAVKRGSDAPAR